MEKAYLHKVLNAGLREHVKRCEREGLDPDETADPNRTKLLGKLCTSVLDAISQDDDHQRLAELLRDIQTISDYGTLHYEVYLVMQNYCRESGIDVASK